MATAGPEELSISELRSWRHFSQLTLHCNQQLANPVFEKGIDATVLALSHQERLPRFLVLYRDVIRASRLHYRLYREGHLVHEAASAAMPELDRAISKYGPSLIQ